LKKILAHYGQDIVMSSPLIARVAGVPSGTLKGVKAVGEYWALALEKVPNLHFEHIQTLVGADSVILYYRGVRGMAAEIFFFGPDGLMHQAAARDE